MRSRLRVPWRSMESSAESGERPGAHVKFVFSNAVATAFSVAPEEEVAEVWLVVRDPSRIRSNQHLKDLASRREPLLTVGSGVHLRTAWPCLMRSPRVDCSAISLTSRRVPPANPHPSA